MGAFSDRLRPYGNTFRMWCAGMLICALSLSVFCSPAFPQSATLTIYDDQLRNGFLDESASWISRDLAGTQVVHSGAFSIFFEPEQWQGLVLSSSLDIDVSDYPWIEFWIHGGNGGGQHLWLDIYHGENAEGRLDLNSILSQGAVPAGEWERVQVSFDDMGLTTGLFNSIRLYNPGSDNEMPVYIDDVRLVNLPQINVSPRRYYFAVNLIGSSGASDLLISNDGLADLNIWDVSLSDPTNFSLSLSGGSDPCSSSLPMTVSPGDSCTMRVTFSPLSEGDFSAFVTITSDDPRNSTETSEFTGIGSISGSENEAVYDNELSGEWLFTGWPCSNGMLPAHNSTATYTGRPGSVLEVVHCDGGWGAFVLDRRTESWDVHWMYPNQYKSLKFRFNPGNNLEGIDTLQVSTGAAYVSDTYLRKYTHTEMTVTDHWYEVTIPLADLLINGERFHSIVLFNSSEEARPAYYLDDIYLEWIPDQTPPILSDMDVTIGATSNTAAFQWTTDEHTDFIFEYGINDFSVGRIISPTYEKVHELALAGLLYDTTYQYRLVVSDHQLDTAVDRNAVIREGTFTTPPIPTTPPAITAIHIPEQDIKWNRATICWQTDRMADSKVFYGVHGFSSQAVDLTPVVDHCMVITGLLQETTYQFYVVSRDLFDNQAESSPLSFTTAAPGTHDVQFMIDSAEDVRPISPYVYGDNYYDYLGTGDMGAWPGSAHNLTLLRLGGNRWTTYNWENNASNAGTDWYNQNDAYLCSDPAVCDTPGEAVAARVETAHDSGAAALVTVPIQGYVAADKNADGDVAQTPNYLTTRFHVSVARKSGDLSLAPDLSDDTTYQDEFVNWLEFYLPDGAIFYSLDNEPDLWAETHHRIHEDAVTYEELVGKTIEFASAIKDIAADAVIFGPVSYGWYGYVTLQDAPDRNGRDFLEYYLDSMKQEEDITGRRLLDILDLHWYPEAMSSDGRRIISEETDPVIVEARIQAPRSLWDSTYTEDSWISQSIGGSVNLIPRLHDKIQTHYPGTGLAFTEYYYGGCGHISGGIAQADVLGIFGREGIVAANFWRLCSDCSFCYSAFDMYRNCDGADNGFGDISISAVTADVGKTSVYASLYSGDTRRMGVLAINKTTEWLDIETQISHVDTLVQAEVYQLTSVSTAPERIADITGILNNSFLHTLPPLSVTLFRLEKESVVAVPGDLDNDGDRDYSDYLEFRPCYRSCDGAPNFRSEADLDHDGCVTINDYRILRTLIFR